MASRTVSEIQTLVRPFAEICLFRRGPQNLPSSVMLLAIVMVAHTIVSIFQNALILDLGTALLAGFTDTLLVATLTGLLLYLLGFAARIVQTITAMTGAGAIIMLAVLPPAAWVISAERSGTANPIAALLVYFGLFWFVGVTGHILRHALSVPLVFGVIIAFAYYGISYAVFNFLFWTGSPVQ